MFTRLLILLAAVAAAAPCVVKSADLQAGAARADITPDYPVRLTGYAGRTTESEGTGQKLWAKALAISSGGGKPAVLVTVDNCGVPAAIADEVAARLAKQTGLPRENLAVCSSHTHCGPMLKGFAANIFVGNDTPEQREHIERYGRELTDKIEEVALQAMQHMELATLEWNEGRVCFAANRRTPGGPVDQALPVLCVRTVAGAKPLAIVANYACHCTTLGGDFNRTHGDWAGSAQEELEKQFSGAVALITVGTGADANPAPRGKVEQAQAHGQELAREASGLAINRMRPLTGMPQCRLQRIELPFSTIPAREEWEKRAKESGITGYHARQQLEKLDRGEKLPDKLPYIVQTWTFGSELAMVFLAGEVVVDYGHWLKEQFDDERLWITAYANDVPCYIPSRRILSEGGYEAESSLWYYDRPARLAPEAEDVIHKTLSTLVPDTFRLTKEQRDRPAAKSPGESQAAIRVGGGLQVEMVASEPLVKDPICVDWDARGRLWVLEMADYPRGLDGKGKAGSRILILTDTDGDGKLDQSTVFAENIFFPTGILCQGNGAWICAAPDILWAEDLDGDGRAEKIEKRFSGWSTENFNARVNGLALGLDNWIHGSGGLIGGVIQPGNVKLQGRDFRFDPRSGKIEAASGNTQQGRPRDDWDHWFGCDNSNLIWHYPLPDHLLRRNPDVAAPAALVDLTRGADANRLHPTSRTLERYNDAHMANLTTSACGLGIYRDNWLGEEYYGNSFTCEPVHNLLRRLVLEPDGISFRAVHPPGELQREFLSSRDNWSRFVQARTGPDGALWIVDMYRFVIEHPTWISEERQKTLDLRAGSEQGRIYRLRVPGKELRAVRDLTKLDDAALAAALNTPNGTERDRVHLEILQRGNAPGLSALLQSETPAVRAQTLSVLSGLGTLEHAQISAALRDPHAGVRKIAARLSAFTGVDLSALADDPSAEVRCEAAMAARDPNMLAKVALRDSADPWMRAAVLSSAQGMAGEILARVIAAPEQTAGREELIAGLAVSVPDISPLLPALLKSPAPPFSLLARLAEQNKLNAAALASLQALAVEAAEKGSIPALHLAARSGAADEWLFGFLDKAGAEAALEELAKRGSDAVRQSLSARLAQSTPGLRAKILHTLRSRPAWEESIVEAVTAGHISASEVPLADRAALVRRFPAAEKLFQHTSRADVAERLKVFADADRLQGDADRGALVFQINCAVCHALNGVGIAVGPDISSYRGKPLSDLVAAIVDPDAVIEPAYVAYEVVTRDGLHRAGIVRDETATSLVLVQPAGLKQTLLRSDVKDIHPMPQSLMPQGLDQMVKPQDAADLSAWLRKAGPAPFGFASPENAAKSRAAFTAGSPHTVAKVIRSSGGQPYRSWMGLLPMHYCRANHDESTLGWETTPAPSGAESVRYQFAAALGFLSQPEGKFNMTVNGRPAITFGVSLEDQIWQNNESGVTASWRVLETNNEDACGVLSIEVPARLFKPGEPVRFEVTGTESGSMRWFGIYIP